MDWFLLLIIQVTLVICGTYGPSFWAENNEFADKNNTSIGKKGNKFLKINRWYVKLQNSTYKVGHRYCK